MKRGISALVSLAMIVSMMFSFSIPAYAGGADPIAIMVENDSFTTSNVGGDADNTLLWKKGSTTLNTGQLLLTNTNSQAGSVVKRNQVKLTDGFSTYFKMYFSGNADGIAFVLYKADTPKVGDIGGALGYGDREFAYYGSDGSINDDIDSSIKDSIVVEFDTWKNYSNTEEQYDPNFNEYNNHVAIMLDGNQVHSTQSDNGDAVYTNASLAGQTIHAWVDYNSGNGTSTTGTVSVTFGTGATKNDAANHTISRTVAIADNTPIAGDNVFIGFTGATGGNATTHKLLKWYFKDSYVAGGLDPTAGTYTQAPATLSVVPNNAGINPTNATISIKDDSGNPLPNKTFSIYIDDAIIAETTPGDYTTGAGASYSFPLPASLGNGNHTIRVVGEGGVTNFAAFTINKHTVTYNGNGSTGGTVPLASIYNDGANVTVSSNSGALVKDGYAFAGWNTLADGSGTTYSTGSGQISNIASDITLFAIWSKFSASAGVSSFVISGDAVVIDPNITIEGFTENISGAKVMIQNKKTGDALNFVNAGGITGTYDATSGVLTLDGVATSAQYQNALRNVKFSTTSNDTTNRTILFSLGEGLYYTTNGHYYEYIESLNISWTDAKAAAELRNLYGRQGYLVTLTSAGENAFVTEKVTALGWIGAKDIHYVNASSQDTLGDWRWVTGPEGLADGGNGTQFYTGYQGASGTTVTYSNWWSGEPNNGGDLEYVAHIFGPVSTMPGWAGGAQPGEWNDFEPGRNDGAVKGYVVEYGGMPGDTPIVVQATKTIEIIVGNHTAEVSANTLTPVAGVNDAITLTVKNNLGNTDANFDGDKTVTITGYEGAPNNTYGSFNGTLLEADGSTNVTISFTDGTATTNLTLNKADEQTLGFSIATVTTPATNQLTITPTHGTATSMTVTQNVTAPIANGGNFAQQPKVTLKDAYGNICTSDNITVITADKEDAGTWTLTGTATATASGGVATFTNLGATNAATVNNAQLGFTSGLMTKVTSVAVTLPAPVSSGGGGGSNTTAQAGQGSVIVIVNGKEQDAGKETKTTEAGKSTVTVEVNNKVIESKIDEAIKNNTGGTENIVQVPVADTKSEVVKVELTGDIVKKLEENIFDVSVKRENIEYIIPAEEFTISKVAENLGIKEADLDDIKVEVKITKLDEKVVEKYKEVAEANGAELVFPPVEFEIVAKTTKTDGTTGEVEISRFSNYVERVMEIPAGIDPSKITTGIVFNADGTYSHVPTEVYQKDGKWFAKLNSMTNSNYSVIWNPVTVKSVENHWSKEAVNEMASRLVIFDPEAFEPNEAITRADFAEYIVRALGLYRAGARENAFKDVSSTGERTLAILIAKEYGIVIGYSDGSFKPEQNITREEAMVMYERAMKITKLTGSDEARYKKYTDYAKVSSWAETYVRAVLSAHVFNGTSETTLTPKSNLTCAEAAQAIKNLLVESKLINE